MYQKLQKFSIHLFGGGPSIAMAFHLRRVSDLLYDRKSWLPCHMKYVILHCSTFFKWNKIFRVRVRVIHVDTNDVSHPKWSFVRYLCPDWSTTCDMNRIIYVVKLIRCNSFTTNKADNESLWFSFALLSYCLSSFFLMRLVTLSWMYLKWYIRMFLTRSGILIFAWSRWYIKVKNVFVTLAYFVSS